MRPAWSAVLVLAACADAAGTDELDTDEGPQPDALTAVSASCPDLSTPGVKTFQSGGLERTFGIWFPEDRPANMPIIFAFHGLVTPDYDAIADMELGFGLPAFADKEPAIVIAPRAQVTNLVIADVLLWGILGDEARQADLTLFDDLRTCVAEAFDADVRRVAAFGHSGGGLWSSVLASARSTMLASVAASSGGTGDFPAPTYLPAARKLPVLLIDGGPTDAWPAPEAPILPFQVTTANFRDALVADGHPVAWCEHDLGHNRLPSWWWKTVTGWLRQHPYGEPSPYMGEDRAKMPSECERYEP